MENLKLQIAFRRSKQKREGQAYLERMAGLLSVNMTEISLLDPSDSLQFERALFARTKKGFSDGSIRRTMEIPEAELAPVITNTMRLMRIKKIIVGQVNFMQFAFLSVKVPTPKQMLDLVKMDGDSIFVADLDLSCGIGVDTYESEIKGVESMRYEVDVWGPDLGPQANQ